MTLAVDEQFISTVADILNKVCVENRECDSKVQSYFTSKKQPSISIYDYIARIVRHTNCTSSIIILILIYLDRLTERHMVAINNLTIHRLIILSVVIAIKMHEDDHYSNEFFARLGGIPLKELNNLEIRFLFALDFDTNADKKLFEEYQTELTRMILSNL